MQYEQPGNNSIFTIFIECHYIDLANSQHTILQLPSVAEQGKLACRIFFKVHPPWIDILGGSNILLHYPL